VGLPPATVTSLSDLATNLNFLVFGLILVVTMLLRPQGLVPSRQRQQELREGTHGGEVVDVRGVA
jgi:ABC-type branched-subunit amino acid transport system permease subunit